MNTTKNKVHHAVFCCLLIGLASSVEAADPTPGGVMEQGRQMRDYLEQQRRLRPREADDEPIVDNQLQAPEEKKGGNGKSFLLQLVEVGDSAVLSPEQIAGIVTRYSGRQVRIGDLFELVGEINAAYREAGAIAAQAILPPQKIENGVVRLRLVEGRVGNINVSRNESTEAGYIVDRLGVQAGDLVLQNDLEEKLFYFNSVNDINLRAVLKPGEAFATTDYEVRVEEPQRRSAVGFVDNAGQKDVGLYRAGFSYIDRSLTGERDILTLGGHVARGTRAINGSYNFPVGTRGARVGLSVDYSRIKIVDGSLEPLNITGDSVNVGLAFTHPLVVERGLVMNGFAGANYKTSSTDFDGSELLSKDTHTLSLGVDTKSEDIDSSWFLRGWLTSAQADWGSDESFNKVNLEFSRVALLGLDRVLTVRVKAQFSDSDLLPSSEQFQVGGMSTVRGYPEGLLIGDHGYMVSAELSLPFPPWGKGGLGDPFADRYRSLVFIDHGAAFPFKGNNESTNSDDFVTSIGAGVSINLDKTLTGRVLVGIPVMQRDDGEDEPTFHAYLQHDFL